ncbi:hypothetical protein QBC41DRAFT_326685 [Cercophora samala]|uniref:Uncharacterized protein n=1 Tax=Cercophora samala TaxID=330535 RepID=A0AA39Z9M9_9PEZI|nr:hypothetical protein QBC41DRAFT_326685 [Cercophora samala]
MNKDTMNEDIPSLPQSTCVNDRSFTVAEDGGRPHVASSVTYKFMRGDEVWLCLPGQEKDGPYVVNTPKQGTSGNIYSLCDESCNDVKGGQFFQEAELKFVDG